MSFGASVGVMTFFTTLREKEREELLSGHSFLPGAAFMKEVGNCCDLETFLPMMQQVK